MRSHAIESLKSRGILLVSFAAFLLLWEAAAITYDNSLVLPTASEVFTAILENVSLLSRHSLVTFAEAFSGFVMGSFLAFVLAVWFVHSEKASKALYPYAIVLKATPLIALAPLLVFWFGNGFSSKVVMAGLVAFFPVIVNGVKGLKTIDAEALDLFRSLSASRLQIFLKLRFPSSLPFLFSALKIAAILAVVGAIIGEFTGASEGIGFIITNSSYYLDTPLMFAGIVFAGASGLALFSLVSLLEKRVVFWEAEGSEAF